jgi:hypothetical protein
LDIAGKHVVLNVIADHEPDVDMWTALERSEYLRKVFDLESFDVRWQPSQTANTNGAHENGEKGGKPKADSRADLAR